MANKEMSTKELYFSLTQKYNLMYGSKTIVLMQVGSFFEVYGLKDEEGNISESLIEEYGKMCGLAVVEKKENYKKKKVVMAGFRDYIIDKYTSILEENGYTGVIYKQEEGNPSNRILWKIVSPGTSFSSNVSINKYTNNACCIWLHNIKNNFIGNKLIIGISMIDVYTGKTIITEYSNIFYHNPTTYDELEHFTSIYNPVESIIIHNLNDNTVNDIIQFIGLNSTKIHKLNLNNTDEIETNDNINIAKNCENQVYQKACFEKYFPQHNITIIFDEWKEYTISIQSFCYLLAFVDSHNPNLTQKLTYPILEKSNNKLILANHSLKQLNIINDNNHIGKFSSVIQLLNKCESPMGKRKFDYILLNPIKNIDTLNKSYEITDYLLNQANFDVNEWKNKLKKIPDLDKLQRKCILEKITPKDFYNIYKSFEIAEDFHKYFSKNKLLKEYVNNSSLNKNIKNIKNFIKNHFNLKNCQQIDNLNFEKLSELDEEDLSFINRNINNDLDNILKEKLESRDKLSCIKNKLESYLEKKEKGRSSKCKDGLIKIHETTNMGVCLQLTQRRGNLLKASLDELNVDDSHEIELNFISKFNNNENSFNYKIKDLEYFINDKKTTLKSSLLNKLYSDINNSKTKYIYQLNYVYKNIIKEFLKLIGELNNVSEMITTIDVLYCKYSIATEFNYCKPTIKESSKSFVELTEVRHCLVEHLQQNELYVTNDVSLGVEKNGICLFGTNAVGKTCLIKSIGICVIMAQCGLYVPCKSMVYYPYDYIFTRILGNDNLFKGLSTFEVEMSELRIILKNSTKNSLVLGDELCSGTEIKSALSLFVAGLEMLHSKDSSFIFATHFHKIVSYDCIQKLNKLCMKHMSVIYNQEQQKLIYDRKLKDGSGKSIYGLEVCKSLNLPDEFLERAYQIRNLEESSHNVLSMPITKYNKNKIRSICDMCKNEVGTEIHHMQYQRDAINGYITGGSLNNAANLMSVCEKCHNKIHKEDKRYIKQKTSSGYELVEK